MSLPKAFNSASDYFVAAVEFLHEYAWIYEHANTRCLQAGVFERMPQDMSDFFARQATNEQLNNLPLLHDELQLPPSLDTFRRRLKRLTPTNEMPQERDVVDAVPLEEERRFARNLHKVSAKKQHEILKLSQKIVDVLIADPDADGQRPIVVDFGAGLGYLSETLYRRLNSSAPRRRLRLVGLESEPSRVASAQQRQQQYMPEALGDIVYKQLHIDLAAQSAIEEAAQALNIASGDVGAEASDPAITIVGLHACADLSVTAMQLFMRMPRVRNLVIMPCCYHKLQLHADASTFVHFPLSQTLCCAARAGPTPIFNRPFLRLACQETSARWLGCTVAQHLMHGRAMFWRAVAEVLAGMSMYQQADGGSSSGATVVIQKRSPNVSGDFGAFCHHYALRAHATGEVLPWQPQHARTFEALCQRYDVANDVGAKLAEGLTCLQTALQRLCENIVLLDRLCYMEEAAEAGECAGYGCARVRVKAHYEKVLNEKLSPRCFALIAQKLHTA